MCKQKGVPYALVLTFVNFATSTACQKQSNGNAPLDVYIHILNVWAMAQCFFVSGLWDCYIRQCGAFDVARFDRQGNAKAYKRGTSNRIGSTLFLCP